MQRMGTEVPGLVLVVAKAVGLSYRQVFRGCGRDCASGRARDCARDHGYAHVHARAGGGAQRQLEVAQRQDLGCLVAGGMTSYLVAVHWISLVVRR